MKKNLLTLALIIFYTISSYAQYVTIPDSNFVSWLKTTADSTCIVGQQLDTLCSRSTPIEIQTDQTSYNNQTVTLDLSNHNLQKLSGFEFLTFNALFYNSNIFAYSSIPTYFSTINLSHNSLTQFPDQIMKFMDAINSGNFTVQTIDLSYNQIDTYAHQSSRDVYSLNLSHNGMHHFNIVSSTAYDLTNINLDYNNLSSLPSFYYHNANFLTQNCLLKMSVRHNLLHNIPSGYFTSIDAGANLITTVNFSSPCYYPIDLTCDSNLITSINLSGRYNNLNISHNSITNLNLASAITINSLICHHNNIQSISNIPSFLQYLDCHNNSFLTCLPTLPLVSLLYLNIDSTSITCLPNRYIVCTYTGSAGLNTMPICNYGNSPCIPYHMIEGYFYSDTNSNCVRDSNESICRSARVLLQKNGQYSQSVYTDTNGYYGFTLSDTGSYTITFPDTLMVVSCMSNGGQPININASSNPVTDVDFGVQCKNGFDLAASMLYGQFRVGWTHRFLITAGDISHLYNLSCIHNIGGTVKLIIDGPAGYAYPLSGSLIPYTNSRDTVIWNISDFANINNTNDFNIAIAVDSNAHSGDQVCIKLLVSPISGDIDTSNNMLSQCFIVVNSFDPNKKSVYPISIIDSTSQWLTYTIDFQNTGTDTAHNVYIFDTLDVNHFDITSFHYIGSSHRCIAQILDSGIARFGFPNINLPDSLINQNGSQGWIQYKIKLKAGFPAGTQIKNTASIYFDLNTAIVTNTTINSIICSNTYNTLSQSICIGDSFTIGTNIYRRDGTYHDTLTSAGGCDSIITLTLSVHSATSSSFSHSICTGSSYLFGGHSLTSGSTYHDTLTNAGGCDSIITLTLTINPLPTVPAITRSGLTLSTTATGLHYQWQRNGVNIVGDTTASITTTQNGSYTLIVTNGNGCSSNSSAINVTNVGINDIGSADSHVILYPNPASSSFTLAVDAEMIGTSYNLSDMTGRIIYSPMIEKENTIVSLDGLSSGIYILQINGMSYKVVKE